MLDFTKDILSSFSTHYPSSFRKAVILNAPSFLPFFWRVVSTVLPKSVTAKVSASECHGLPRIASECLCESTVLSESVTVKVIASERL